MRDIVFYLGLGTLFTHELDAVPNHEWRQLPLLDSLPDPVAMTLFIAMHVPLFAVLIGLVASRNDRARDVSRAAIAGFLAIHGGLHAASMTSETYEFSSPLSNILIFGGAGLGLLYFGLGARTSALGPEDPGAARPSVIRG